MCNRKQSYQTHNCLTNKFKKKSVKKEIGLKFLMNTETKSFEGEPKHSREGIWGASFQNAPHGGQVPFEGVG